MKIFILAGKSVDPTFKTMLPQGHEYAEAKLATVSRGVRRLEKETVDCVLLVPDTGDTTWSRAIRRIREEYGVHVIVLYTENVSEDRALELGVHDCFKMDMISGRCLAGSLRHLEVRLGLEHRLATKHELVDWMEETDRFGSWEMDREGQYRWSKGLRLVLGKSGAELSDGFKSIRQSVHPDDLDIFDRANEATFQQGWPLDFEYRVVAPGGKVHHLHVNRRVELDSGGAVARAYGMARDVSLQKEFEELLFRRDAILQVLAVFASRFLRNADWSEGLDKAMEELGTASGVTRVFLFSKDDGATSGRESLSLRHEWAADIVSPIAGVEEFQNNDFTPLYESWRTTLLRRKVIAGHVKDFQKGERELFERYGARSIMIVPVFAGTTWWGFLGISEHRKERDWLPIEIESLTLAADIFGSAIHYTAMSKKLKKANQAAEEATKVALEANMAKSMFLANMSHEIRTPISGILGMSEMLVTTGLSPEQREHVDMVRDASNALLSIVNDILDISKIEAGKMELKPEPHDFRKELRTCVRSFGPQAAAAAIVFRYIVAEEVPRQLKGDPLRLGQILRNLIGNSLKFTQTGMIELNVTVSKRVEDKVCLLFQVSDTGEGIAKDKLESIFDVFTQADSSLRKKHQGTGLGLAICRQLVHMMGGEIGVESEPGKGSTFHFTAWFGLVEGEGIVVEEVVDKTPETLHLHILLAEDNPMNRKYLTHFLTMFGHTITAAENGIEAMTALEAKGKEIDLVLMDIQMPEMSGIEATRAIRESDGRLYDRSIPIIALTAYAMQGDRERMLEAGMDDYVSKPIDMKELSATIVRCMGKKECLAGRADTVECDSPEEVRTTLDMDSLLDRFDGNAELLKDILDLFILESAEKLKSLDAGISHRDPKEVGAALHSITNISSHVLAMEVVTLSRKLEKQCYLGDLDAVIKDVEVLRPQFQALVRIVEEELSKL